MLRIRRKEGSALRAAMADEAGSEFEIVPVFADARLELVRLLREAANIEHALLVQYLYAGFSVKERYRTLRGGPVNASGTLLGIAVQEMRHLARVNELLVALGALPNLDRLDFPITSGVYPFKLELEPLTRTSVAKYVTAEAPLHALDVGSAPTDEERRFREAVHAALGMDGINHIGSLYRTIIARLRQAVAAEPKLLPDLDRWLSVLEGILGQGEEAHFRFFRSVFEATHPAFGGADVWRDPASDIFPSRPLPKNPSAFPSTPGTISDPAARDLAWLSDLHYWTVLALLHLGHTDQDSDPIGHAISHMVGCLYPLGLHLADKNLGLPFDALALNVGPGLNTAASRSWLARLLSELRAVEDRIGDALPTGGLDAYSRGIAAETLNSLGGA